MVQNNIGHFGVFKHPILGAIKLLGFSMDIQALKESALKLKEELINSSSSEAKALLVSLRPLLEKAISQEIESALEWNEIPGSRSMVEGDFRALGKIETYYADFRIEITGGEPPSLKRLRARHGQ